MAPIKIATFTLPKILMIAAVICVCVVAVWYLLFQARFLISGPQLILKSAPYGVQEERQITLEGIAKNITAIYLNDRPIFTNSDGAFHEKVVLENGYTIVNIRAYDRYGRSTSLERSFVYTPQTSVQ